MPTVCYTSVHMCMFPAKVDDLDNGQGDKVTDWINTATVQYNLFFPG